MSSLGCSPELLLPLAPVPRCTIEQRVRGHQTLTKLLVEITQRPYLRCSLGPNCSRAALTTAHVPLDFSGRFVLKQTEGLEGGLARSDLIFELS